eukprot:317386-Prymnesium_polylepis.1
MRCVGGGSRACERRVPLPFCVCGGPGLGGRPVVMGLACLLLRRIGGRRGRRGECFCKCGRVCVCHAPNR